MHGILPVALRPGQEQAVSLGRLQPLGELAVAPTLTFRVDKEGIFFAIEGFVAGHDAGREAPLLLLDAQHLPAVAVSFHLPDFVLEMHEETPLVSVVRGEEEVEPFPGQERLWTGAVDES